MSQNKLKLLIMIKTLIFGILFLFASECISSLSIKGRDLFNERSPPLMNAYRAQNGINTIFKDDRSFYVGVDLQYSYNEDDSDSDFGPNTVPMLLSLYTSNVWLADDCLSYYQYDCSEYSCNKYTWQDSNESLLDFSAIGYQASVTMYLDYFNWRLASYANIATSCNSSTYYWQQPQTYGVLGLGRDNSAQNNFIEF